MSLMHLLLTFKGQFEVGMTCKGDTHFGDGERHAEVLATLKSEAPWGRSDQGHAVAVAHDGRVTVKPESNTQPDNKSKDLVLMLQQEIKHDLLIDAFDTETPPSAT